MPDVGVLAMIKKRLRDWPVIGFIEGYETANPGKVN